MSEASELDIQEDDDAIVVKVHVQPRAQRERVTGVHGDALKVQLSAPPVGGRANDACVAFFARALKIPKAKIAIISGAASREKRVRIRGASRAEIEDLIPAAKT